MTNNYDKDEGMAEVKWVKLDTAWPRNRKTLDLLARKNGHRALVVYIAGLCYSGEQGSAGYIQASALPMLHAKKADADMLVEVGMWVPKDGGWEINGWDEHQLSTAEMQKRRERAQHAAVIRWSKPDKIEAPF